MNMTQATHAFVAGTCNTCHGTTTVSFYIGAANPGLQLRPADHSSGTMLTGDCSGCHTTANWNSTTMPSNHMPNPANQACSTCHTKSSTGDYTPATLAANAVLHTGITSGCITCHGAPNATAPVYATSYTPKPASGLSPVHIPTSTTACESCHSNTVFTAFSGTTMSSAKHTAMFAVIGKTCDACHDASTLKFYGVTNLTTRPNGHHTGQDCSGCHNTSNWGGGAQAKKTATAPATAAAKVSAVAGAAATSSASPSAVRMPNGEWRDPRGVALARLNARTGLAGPAIAAAIPATAAMSHVGVLAGCADCHNGVLAAGKGPTHVASNNTCENCHTTAAWIPARFDHRGVTGTCASCHNGVAAPGKPTRHIQTTQDCAACHGTLAWMPAAFNHVGITATCQSCHNGITATGKQPQHLATTQDCATCHSTLGWTTAGTGVPKAPLHPLITVPKAGPRATTPGPQR
jgi:hypothetical protein